MAEREILFRGKRTYNGKWVEGSLVVTSQCNAYIISTVEDKRDATVLVNQCSLNVDPETVGQYTGLTDKNGVRIFEGDILTIENEGVYAAIKYNESNAAFYVEDEDHEDYLGEAWETDVIIIGNIHDNPDILKGGGDNG